MECAGDPMTTSLAPRDLQTGRHAGVCLHITSLPGPYGIGEIGQEAREFIDMLASTGIDVWQFLPTGPTAYGDSPYQPLSSFAGNELLISIGDLVAEGLLAEFEVEELKTLPERAVDYGTLIPIKRRLLDVAAQRFPFQASKDVQAQYAAFVEEHDSAWLHDYALFRILKSSHGERPWPEWLPKYAHRDERALKRIEATEAHALRSIKVIQFLFHRQWLVLREYAAASGVALFGDMPIYIALDSADAWANRDILLLDEDGNAEYVAGVPPDYFTEDGQLWGNPLYDWEKHAASNYRWWIDRLSMAMERMDLVRIDHFRGFEAFWAVPAASETARTGTWEPGPGDAIFEALRDALGVLPIVAENLGVITPEVEALRERHGIPGMHVLQFDVCDDDFDLACVARDSVCYTGTHDNDTTIGWFHGSPGDMRSDEEIEQTQKAVLAMTGGTAETVHTDLARAAFATDARIAIATMQDYLGLGSEARLNTPGKPGGNWRWRMAGDQFAAEIRQQITDLVRASGRSPESDTQPAEPVTPPAAASSST